MPDAPRERTNLPAGRQRGRSETGAAGVGRAGRVWRGWLGVRHYANKWYEDANKWYEGGCSGRRQKYAKPAKYEDREKGEKCGKCEMGGIGGRGRWEVGDGRSGGQRIKDGTHSGAALPLCGAAAISNVSCSCCRQISPTRPATSCVHSVSPAAAASLPYSDGRFVLTRQRGVGTKNKYCQPQPRL